MACMEHRCLTCVYVTFNNKSREPGGCPSCGVEMIHYFEEDRKRREHEAAMRID